jgi:hypothetical protein
MGILPLANCFLAYRPAVWAVYPKTKELTRSRPSSSVEVKDISLVDYVNVQHAVYLRKWR